MHVHCVAFFRFAATANTYHGAWPCRAIGGPLNVFPRRCRGFCKFASFVFFDSAIATLIRRGPHRRSQSGGTILGSNLLTRRIRCPFVWRGPAREDGVQPSVGNTQNTLLFAAARFLWHLLDEGVGASSASQVVAGTIKLHTAPRFGIELRRPRPKHGIREVAGFPMYFGEMLDHVLKLCEAH